MIIFKIELPKDKYYLEDEVFDKMLDIVNEYELILKADYNKYKPTGEIKNDKNGM